MKYSYKFKLNQKDMFKYYMIDRYSSLAGIVQIIFMISMVILIFTKWNVLGTVMKILVLIGLSLFTIIQPLAFWINAGKSINPNMPKNEISFDENDMTIKVNDHIQRMPYQKIVRVVSKPKLLIVQPDEKHLYILPTRILNGEKKDLFEFLKSRIT